jgi:hypothetical protein
VLFPLLRRHLFSLFLPPSLHTASLLFSRCAIRGLGVVDAGHIGACRAYPLREPCHDHPSTARPRRVRAVVWPLSSLESGGQTMVTSVAHQDNL